ncbi:hypothetical protein Angca_009346, partial [Angiostrongylus cantonensis]
AAGESTVQTWFRKFSFGDFELEDKESHGRPNELGDCEVKTLVEANTRASARELAEQLGLSSGTIS